VNTDKCQDIPTTIRLKELRAIYQKEAIKIDRSMHWLIISVLKKAPFVAKALEEMDKENNEPNESNTQHNTP